MAITQEETKANSSAPAATSGGKWSFHDKGAFGRTPIARSIGSESLVRLQAALYEEYKNTDSSFEITLIPLDNANEPAYYSSLIVCLRDRKSLKDGVAFHTLVIEATGDPIVARAENINGEQVEITRVAGDSYDQTLMAMINARVSEAFPGVAKWNTLATVVPRTFNIDDKVAVHALALNAGLATSTELDTRMTGFTDLNLANNTADSKLNVALSFSNQQVENVVGDPVRADIGISFTSQQSRNFQNASLNSADKAERIASLTGFVDMIWAPLAPQQGMFGAYGQQQYGQPMQMPTQQYSSRLVVTSMESTRTNTVASQLLSLVTALSVGADNNWMQALRPTPEAGKRINMHDIGALGIEATGDGNGTFGKRVDTSADHFRPENLGQLITALIRPGMVLSADVPECGPETWYLSVFSAAANGMQEAMEALENGANTLTNNAFGRHFPKGTQIFTDLGNRVHMGYYTDEKGVKRDLRDIDYLAIANLMGDRDPGMIRAWSDTFTRTEYRLEKRLAERKRIIAGLLPSAVFTGFAHRVTFRQQFTDALALACRDVGLNMQITTPMNSGELNNVRGVGSFVSDALISSASPSVFNQGGGMPINNTGYNVFNSRWGR
jgi:hypothetical protein